ncbi:autotransporter-associated beta strand repeat-containing protein [Sphingopyxis sp. MSC1_008]|jgi:fibronectin-binding autotransporter adhesin|uniref:autotransporter-associated beta strand repeat-containing protein n=1 Tax=Sphingopyxis sp. MSC1_008 TaxID=2909265 RepID=UPI0020BF1E8C|nr:autotransporter-associated beta strand repeat-containing protein [Sphingopyxis sp. MSC1_008]
MTIDRESAPRTPNGPSLTRRLLCGASLAAVLACAPLSARAEDRYWDANGTAVGSGGTGTWNLANLNWSPNGDGVSGPFVEPWINGDIDNAIFGGTAGTVTVAVPVTVGNITFNSAGYVLNGSTLTLGGPAPTITTNVGNSNVTINSTIAGSSGLVKAGSSGLILNGTSSFTGGITLNAGSIYAASDAALGALSNNIVTAAGVEVRLSIGGASTSRAVAIGDGGRLRLEGSGAGSALISGNGSVRVAESGVTMSNDLNTYTGQTIFTGCNGTCSARFTSLRNLGEASALGAPVTVADGTIIFNQQSQYSDSLIYLGDGDSSNRNWDINGNNAVIRNQGTGTLSITGDIDVSTGGTFIADTANVELLGVLSGGAFGFNGAAGNTVTLGNANTFTGQATIAGLVNAAVLADTGVVSSLGAGATIGLSAGALRYVGTGNSSNRSWVVHGTSGIQNDGTGALDLSGNMSFVAGGIADSLTLGGSFTGENRFSGVISGAGGLVANGSGTWVIGGANNFTGNVTVTSGTLKVGNAAAFGPANGLIVNGGTLDLGGFDLVAPSLTGTGGTVSLGAQTLTVDAKTAQVFGGSITGTGGLRKNGAGSLTLTGTNSYTGATTIGGGRLTLDFSGAGGPANDIVSASSPLVLSGGTLEVTGAAGETNSQGFNGLTVNAGSNTVRAISGAGGIVNLNLGAITRAGGLVNFVLPTSGAITTSNADGVLGGWATINGSDYAKVVGGGILAFDASDYTTKDDAATWANGDIISDTANAANTPFFGTVTGDVQLGGLRYTAASGSIIAIGAANTLGIDGTIIVAPSTLATNQNINGGSLTGSAGGGTLGVQHNGTGTLTIGSTIVDNSGATGFAKSGGGTVRLTGTNSYTGGTTLSGGRLEVTELANGGAASGIGASSADAANLVLESGTLAYTGGVDAVTDRGITLVNGGAERAIQVDAGRTVEFSGLVTSPDDAGLTKTGWGTLVLSNAANDYVGVTTITQNPGAGSSTLSVGTLSDGGVASGIGAASSDSANLVISNSARLQYTGGTVAIDRGFTLAGGQGGIDVASAATTLTISGVAAGAGSLFKDGAGTLILSGANTYTGDTTVNGGILRAGSAQAFGPTGRMTVNSGATLELGGFNASFLSVVGDGLIDLGGRTLTTSGAGGVFTGRITGTGGYTRIGGFTQTLSGCNNDYTGVTTVGGTLSIDCIANGGQASSIGASSAASSNLSFAGGTLVYTGASASTDRGFAMTGNGNLHVFDAGTTLEFSGNITGAGQLNKDGAGTLLLSGTNNTTGNVRVINGTVRAGSTTALRSGWVSLDDTAGVLLDLDGYDNTVLYLLGGGTTGGNITLDTATLTISNGGGAGVIYGGVISGSGGLVKNGNGYQQLSGCSSSYGGTTVINGGTLAVDCLGDGGANSSIGSSSTAASNLVLSGGTLRYVGTGGATNRQFTLGASTASKLDASGTGAIEFTHAGPLTFASANTAQTLTLGGTSTANNILAAQITNNGTGATRLTKTDAGTWILTNPGSTYTGITTISGGVLGVDKLADGGMASSIGASSEAASNLVIGNGSTLRYTGSGDTTNRLFTLSQGVTFIESSGTGAIVFTDTRAVTLANNNQARTIALGGTNTGNNTLAGSIGNAGTGVTTLAKNDSGTWVLTGNHSYTGSTNVNGGTLFIGGGGTTGSIASAIVNNFGTLGFNRSDVVAYGGQIGGTGTVRQAGIGTTILTGTNLYTGGTTITAGTLQLGGGGTTGSIVGNVANDGLLVFNRSNLFTFAGLISGSGGVRQTGSGTTVLSGTNSYAGDTSILSGTLQVSADANLGAATGGLNFSSGTLRTTASFASARNTSLSGDGTILTDAGTIFSIDGVISGAGALTKSGTGILTLSGSNSYAGATNVNAGTLLVNGNQSAATGLLTVASGATLGGNGRIGGSVNVLNGGILAPGNSPGTLNIDGNLALAGGSVLNFEFGQADVAGGPLNDLINVGGNLTLDGTINVNVSAGGNFGGGLYRVFNYGGVLVDNGLTLGSMPAGSNVTVQTSVAGQVNLINSDGLSLSFWDGAAGPKFDNVVNGGNGSWHLGGVDNNWTGADGSINAAYADGTFAIFAGAPGTVTVDNSGGAVTATGMQFATGGYLIDGGLLTLAGPDSVVRVGDGTAAGAGFTATIAASLAGASQLVKTDSGTLVLSGANSYTGGTAINGGTVQIASNANLGSAAGGISFDGGTLNTTATFTSNRAISVAGAGTINTNGATFWTATGNVTGAGSLTKAGAGTLILTGDATHSGGTTITQGTLQIGDTGTTGSIAGDILNDGALIFNRTANYSFDGVISGSGSVTQNQGVLSLTANSSYGGSTGVNFSQLRITAGNTVTSGGGLGISQGGLTVSGVGSTFETTSITAQSGTAAATIDVTNGGVLRATAGGLTLRKPSPAGSATANLNVTGAGSLVDLAGGILASSTQAASVSNITISGGGTVRSGLLNTIGNLTGNTTASTITVTGAGSNWTSTGTLLLRNAQLSVLNGGAASFSSAQIGTIAQGANVLVSGTGSTFTTTGTLTVGSTGANASGVLTIADGAQVTAGTGLTLAEDVGTSGSLNIGGVEGGAAAAAGFIDGAISFGDGDGELNFNHVETDYLFANGMSGVGRINHAAGTTRLTGDSSAFTGLTSVAGGTLLVDGALGDAGSVVNVATGGTLGGTGIIGGNVAIAGGNLNPGNIGGIPGTLTIAGNLSLAPAATLNVNFGQANVVGGAYNDLIDVGGDLILGGTLNVTETPGGSFDPGVYRVISYGGTLTDNGLTVDPGYFVQTSVANQVNLVNTTGLTMRFWDGVAGAKNDNAITGGDGLWQASGGNDNWTEFDGSANAPFTDAAFAVFSGLPGTVTVDASLGAVTASGMQFASDGYVIDGDPIILTGVQSVIRVGDGTTAGAGYTATIDSAIAGASQLVKGDLGTLVLTGANSYAGGTRINAGTLSIASDANLGDVAGALSFDGGTLRTTASITSARDVELFGTGTFLTDAGTSLVFSGALTGAGDLIKDGAGILALNDTSNHSGTTKVLAGSLFVNGDQSAATGLTSVALGSTLGGTGIIGGDVSVADGATLAAGSGGVGTLTVNGNLALSAGSLLDFELGQANVAGGSLNDLVDVGGDLVLDGTLNVTVPGGGSFGPGIYRLFNYGGALTDNGLALGAIPGSGVAVQTAISGQVNLVNSAGLTLSFWDGTIGPKNNGAVNGGDGTWQIAGGVNNWTDAAGAVNADYAQDSFAIFSAAPGTVTIDNSGGNVLASGMQFASDGYVLTGDALTLTGMQATIQVGDGSVAGAGYTATIATELTGTAGLVKTDAGTLVLTGANSYAGGTTINGGTIRISSDANLGDAAGGLSFGDGTLHTTAAIASTRAVDLAGDATFLTDAGLTLAGAISGAGSLAKDGAGTLVLTANNNYTGGTAIRAGRLELGDGGTSGAIAGDVVTDGLLAFNRSDSTTFAGLISGGGAIEQIGTGTTILTGSHVFTGGTTITAGTLQLGNGGTSGSIIGDVVNNGTLAFNRADAVTFAGLISGSGGVDHIGSGTTILTGGNSYAGATNVTAGTLLVNGNQSAATGLTSVASGATLGGTGIIGGNVVIADGATLAPGAGAPGALAINGNLSLASGATLGFEFGQANDVGGPLNDVVNVGGNLLLDGTLDVAVPVGGAFDIGLYRVINYAGSLTDNGLALGTMPAGANAQVQTSIAGEVNLINTGSATLNFWDGAAGPKFDGAVNGGDGVWQNSLGNDNWADIGGAVNAGYADGAFAIFSGTAGTVTVDNSLGAVSASGMQFAAGGYRIIGDVLTLDGAQAVIRVGDGTAAGAAYVATIDAELTGAAELVKTDAGTLVLTGANGYTGGTSINGGTLQIGADANLGGGAIRFDGGTLQTTASFTLARGVELIGTGGFRTDAGTTLTLAGALSGAGSFTKSGDGTLVLDGSGAFGGATVGGGTMFVNGDYAAATGTTNVLAGATLGGTGTIGGNVAIGNGATLAPGAGAAGTLTVGGNLSLSATTQLDFDFGAVGVVGGALNDLVNVGGDLVLDGVLNVGVPAGSAFDIGVYRMFNYGGALTDNGVTLGTMPAGANAVVQTAVAGQVNLVNSAGLALNFWDGAAGPKNNGTINGGNGVWQASGGNDNWTDEDGAVNAGYADGAFAIFGGTGGTVTVDNSLGAVSVVGMQFAANNYVITGGGIELTDPTATIRVGDGSAAGAGFTATINSVLGGAAQLVKSDAGTLVLGGTNSYAGGTLITGGTLRISSDANLGAAGGDVTLDGGTLETSASLASARDIVVASSGAISAAADTVFTYNGLFSGSGTLTKNGAGTLLVTADNGGFGGSTAVAGGTLAVQGSLGGAANIGSAGRLEGAGRVGSLVNAGVVAPGSSIGSLTVSGDYAGNGGVLEIEAELGGDASLADRLIVNGATSGNTRVTVINRGGIGDQTVEGIKIVDVAGASNGSFTLEGDYLFDGEQAVVVGAYGYRLYKNGVSTPQDGDWYLRSALLAGENPQGPLYQPGVPVYEAYVGALQSLNRLPTLQQRVGNRSWAASPIAGAGLWGRFESERQRPDALVSTSGADRKVDQWQAQLGLDAVLAERSDGAALVGGLTAHYGKADSAVTSIFGDGTIDTQGYGVGATMTWYGPKGFYVDGQVKLSWFDSDLESNVLGSLVRGNKGDGQAFSLELGKQTPIGRNLSITPQVQMSYAKVDFDRFADPAEAAVSVAKGESLKTRWGLAIDHQTSWKGRSGDTRRTRLYSVVNLSYEWLDGAEADVSGTPVANRDRRLSGELGLGGSYSWGDDRFTLYTEVSGDTAIADFGAGYNLKGTAGFRVRF